MDLRLDNCSHCACTTTLDSRYTIERAIGELERGSLNCWNCEDQEDDDGHCHCVVLMDDDDKILWDGRCQKG